MGAWEETQRYADMLLAEGFWSLLQAPEVYPPGMPIPAVSGNYLISLGGQPLYTGEAGDLAHRLGQHFSSKRSGLPRRYRQWAGKDLELNKCRAQYVHTVIGRKELEESAIVSARCPLNRMHATSRYRYAPAHGDGAWRSVQAIADQVLDGGAVAAVSVCDEPWDACQVTKVAGVYVVRNGLSIIYVGESDGLATRHRDHCTQMRKSALRRNVARDILGYVLGPKNVPRMGLTAAQDADITSFLNGCRYASLPAQVGRLELEAALIGRYQPRLNRRGRQRSLE